VQSPERLSSRRHRSPAAAPTQAPNSLSCIVIARVSGSFHVPAQETCMKKLVLLFAIAGYFTRPALAAQDCSRFIADWSCPPMSSARGAAIAMKAKGLKECRASNFPEGSGAFAGCITTRERLARETQIADVARAEAFTDAEPSYQAQSPNPTYIAPSFTGPAPYMLPMPPPPSLPRAVSTTCMNMGVVTSCTSQ